MTRVSRSNSTAGGGRAADALSQCAIVAGFSSSPSSGLASRPPVRLRHVMNAGSRRLRLLGPQHVSPPPFQVPQRTTSDAGSQISLGTRFGNCQTYEAESARRFAVALSTLLFASWRWAEVSGMAFSFPPPPLLAEDRIVPAEENRRCALRYGWSPVSGVSGL